MTGPIVPACAEELPPHYPMLKLFFRQGGEAVRASPEVHRLRRYQNSDARWNRDHVAAFTARSTFVSVAKSVPALTRTVAAPSTNSIIPAALPGRAVEQAAAHPE
jgi:hypothetical protein